MKWIFKAATCQYALVEDDGAERSCYSQDLVERTVDEVATSLAERGVPADDELTRLVSATRAEEQGERNRPS